MLGGISSSRRTAAHLNVLEMRNVNSQLINQLYGFSNKKRKKVSGIKVKRRYISVVGSVSMPKDYGMTQEYKSESCFEP